MSRTPNQTLSDEEILSGCHAGRDSSRKAFVDRFSGLVHWSIWKYTEGLPHAEREEVAQEIFQDFFLRLAENKLLGQLTDAGKLRKFVVVSATHMTQNKLRQRRRVASREKPMEGVTGEKSAAQVIWDEKEDQRLDKLTSAIAELNPKEKTLLDFHYGEGLTHADIGLLLGIPQDTVSTVIRRSKEKIKRMMGEHGED